MHPFDDADAWTGHATLVHEAVADLARREKTMTFSSNDSNDSNERGEQNKTGKTEIAAFVTCVGGGGLLMGILQGLRETGLASSARVVAAETLGADSMASSLEAGAVTTLPGITSVAKSLGAAAPSARVFAEAHELYEKRVPPLRVSDEDAVRACPRFADDHRVLVEPACGRARAPCTAARQCMAREVRGRAGRRGGVRRRDRRPGISRRTRSSSGSSSVHRCATDRLNAGAARRFF